MTLPSRAFPVLLLASALCFVDHAYSSDLPKLNCSTIATSLNLNTSSNGIAEVTGCYDFRLANVSTSAFNTSILVNLTSMMETYRAQTGSWDYCRVSVTLLGFNSSIGGLIALTGSNAPYPWCSIDIHIEDCIFAESRFGLIGVDFVSDRHTHVTLNVTNTNMFTRNTTLYAGTAKALLYFIQGLSPTWSDFEIAGMAPLGILGYSNFSGPNTNIVLDRVTLVCRNTVPSPVFAMASYCAGMTLGLGSAISFDAGARFLLRDSTLTGYSNYQFLLPAGLVTIQSSLLFTRGASLVIDRSTISGTSSGTSNVTGAIVIQVNRPDGPSVRRFELSDGSTFAVVNSTITVTTTDSPCSAVSVIADSGTIDISRGSGMYVVGTTLTADGQGSSKLAAGCSLMADKGSLLVRERSWVRLHNCTIRITSTSSIPAPVVLRGQSGAVAEVSDKSDITIDRVLMVSTGVGPATGIIVEFIKGGTRFEVLRQSAFTVVNCSISAQSGASAGSVPQGPVGVRFNVYDNATLRVANSSTISVERTTIAATATSGGSAPLARGIVFLTYSAQFVIEGGSSVLISQTTINADSSAALPTATAAYGVHIEGYLPTAHFALRTGSSFVIDSSVIVTSAKFAAYSFAMNTTLAPNPTIGAACSFAVTRTTSTAAITFPATTVGALRFALGPARHIDVKGTNPQNTSQARAGAIVLDRIESSVTAAGSPVAGRPIADFLGSVAPVYADSGTAQRFVFASCVRQNNALVTALGDPVLTGSSGFSMLSIAVLSSAQCAFPDASVTTGNVVSRASHFNETVCLNALAFQFGCGFGAYGGWNSIFNGSTSTQFVASPAPLCECACTNQAVASDSPVDNAIECVVRAKVPRFNLSNIDVQRIVVDSIKLFVSPSGSRTGSRSADTFTTSKSGSYTMSITSTVTLSVGSRTASTSFSPGTPTLEPTRSATVSATLRPTATATATSTVTYYRGPSFSKVASATHSRSKQTQSASASNSAATKSGGTPSASPTPSHSVTDTASVSKRSGSVSASLSVVPVVTPSRQPTATQSAAPTHSGTPTQLQTKSGLRTPSVSASPRVPPTATRIVVTPTASPSAIRSTTLSRSRAPTVTVPVPPTPAPTPPPTLESVPETVVEATETTVGSTAAASGALASPGAAMQASRALAVLALASCDFRHDRPVAFPGTMWPKFAVGEKRVGGYYRGAVVSCFLSTLGFLGVCVVVGTAFKFHKRRSLGEVLSTLRFPGTLVFIVGFVQDGLISNAVSTLRHAEATGTDIALLGFILFLFILYVYVVTKICMSLSMSKCSIQKVPLGLLAAPVTLCGGGGRKGRGGGGGDGSDKSVVDEPEHLSKAERKKLKATLNFRLKRFMIGERLWLPRKLNKGDEDRLKALKSLVPEDLPHDSPQAKRLRQRERAITRGQDVFTNKEALKSCGFIFKKYHRNARFFYTLDLLFAAGVSALKGIRPATHSGCVGVMVGVLILTAIVAVLALVTRPYLIAAKNLLLVLASVLTAFAALMVLGGTAAESGKMLLIGQGAAATSGYITIGSLAVSLYRRAALTHHERMMARKREKEFDDGKVHNSDSDSQAGEDADAFEMQTPLLEAHGRSAEAAANEDGDSSSGSAVAVPADDNGRDDVNRVDFELDYFLGPSKPRDADENAIVATLDDLRVVDPFVYNLALKAPSETQREFILKTARTHQGRQFARTMESVVTDHMTRHPAMPTRAQEFYAEPPSSSWPVRSEDGTFRGPL